MSNPQIIHERGITPLALTLFSEGGTLLPQGDCFEITYTSGMYGYGNNPSYTSFPCITNMDGLKWWIKEAYSEKHVAKMIELIESADYITQIYTKKSYSSSERLYTFQCYKATR